MKAAVLSHLGKPGARGLTKSELARELGVSPKERAELRKVIDRLVEEGALVEGKKSRFEVPRGGERGVIVGRMRIFPRGHGTVYPDVSSGVNEGSGFDLDDLKRVSIPDSKTGTAMDGDRVAVKVTFKRGRNGEPEAMGVVERIVERASRLVVGTYFNRGGFSYIQPDSEALPPTLELEGETDAKEGQKVAVELIEWRKGETPRGRVKEVIGWPDQPGVDIMSVLHKYGLQTAFPEEVLAEAKRVDVEPDKEELERREDWTDRLVITIDPVDAKDHDDAVWMEKTDRGWRLAVHIADVSHYVKPGTQLDKEARKRGNSTYLVDRVLPMLPENLSNGICSLRPNELRLTKCAVMEFDQQGMMRKSHFVDAYINSQAKLAYEEAQVILNGGSAPARFQGELKRELEKLVRESWKLASVLRKRRFARGALDLEMDEIKVLIDDQKKAVGYEHVEYNESHQLVEEFMLAANEAVAKRLRDRNKPAIYRVHADPDPEKLEEFAELARVHGYRVGDMTNKAHIQAVLDQAIGTPEEHNMKLGLLRSLRRAEYSEEPLGHYGLSKADYAHFTSPIRRYADLVVHRALQSLLRNRPEHPDRTMRQKDCKEIAIHISDTERNSSFAEQETKTLKLLEWLEDTRQDEKPPEFKGVITEVRSMGIFVEATDIMQKGLVKYEDLPGRGWKYDGNLSAFISPKGLRLQMGVEVELVVAKVDFVEQRVDFAIVGAKVSEDQMPKKGRGAGGSKGRNESRKDSRNSEGRGRSNDSRNRGSGGKRGRGGAKGSYQGGKKKTASKGGARKSTGKPARKSGKAPQGRKRSSGRKGS